MEVIQAARLLGRRPEKWPDCRSARSPTGGETAASLTFVAHMFEDFDTKTVLATEKAQALAEQLQDESVATGHLIYGLTLDQSVCLHHIFSDLNVDPDMFSDYVNSLPREPEIPNGPWNRHCMTVFERARDTAQDLGQKKVRPEHMALAVLSIKAGSCYETLKEFSIDPEYVQQLIMQAMGMDAEEVPEWF